MRNRAGATFMLLIILAGCSGAANRDTTVAPNARIVVQVRNDAFYDATVYLVRSSSERVRIGIANSFSTTNLTVPRMIFNGIEDVKFQISWIGRSGHDVSESVLAQPGDTIGLEIR